MVQASADVPNDGGGSKGFGQKVTPSNEAASFPTIATRIVSNPPLRLCAAGMGRVATVKCR